VRLYTVAAVGKKLAYAGLGGLLLAVGWAVGGRGGLRADSTWNGLPIVTDVPTSPPGSGVYLDAGDVHLVPTPDLARVRVTAARAIQVADRQVNTAYFDGAAPTALLANVTIEDTLPPAGSPSGVSWAPYQLVPTWVVTYAAPARFQACAEPSPDCEWVTHWNELVNADTGQAAEGFYTP
jgi:hypothetical protein